MRALEYANLVDVGVNVARSQMSNLERIGLIRRLVRKGQPMYELTDLGLDALAQIRDDIALAQGVDI
ncbi:hypothetical protein B1199_02950 [Pseudoalteromonas ulvae]|uniref:Transcriptional regulator n=2 Tax=Pseudoalteromonas ulvae TaxID=107327 RepID=A0A244CUH5_PSEDV|nr:hypothetical protein B1199_02950 [Pseudoalteromonas ulvae]